MSAAEQRAKALDAAHAAAQRDSTVTTTLGRALVHAVVYLGDALTRIADNTEPAHLVERRTGGDPL